MAYLGGGISFSRERGGLRAYHVNLEKFFTLSSIIIYENHLLELFYLFS